MSDKNWEPLVIWGHISPGCVIDRFQKVLKKFGINLYKMPGCPIVDDGDEHIIVTRDKLTIEQCKEIGKEWVPSYFKDEIPKEEEDEDDGKERIEEDENG